MSLNRDLYTEITAKVISQFESGTAPWIRPWKIDKNASMVPVNLVSGNFYRGINVFLLWASGYTDLRFCTYNQARSKGGFVRKGERGTNVILYKPLPGKVNAMGEKEKNGLLMRSFTVFNISQIDGLPDSYYGKPDTGEVVAPVEYSYTKAIEYESQAKIVHGGNRACYIPSLDEIHMPNMNQFKSESEYHATALHELTHWTGIDKRCDRQFGKRFGDNAYAFEELVAEMGAAFLCGHAGIEYQTQHASYIKHWCDILKGDKKSIITAASNAQKACDFVLKHTQNNEDEEETQGEMEYA